MEGVSKAFRVLKVSYNCAVLQRKQRSYCFFAFLWFVLLSAQPNYFLKLPFVSTLPAIFRGKSTNCLTQPNPLLLAAQCCSFLFSISFFLFFFPLLFGAGGGCGSSDVLFCCFCLFLLFFCYFENKFLGGYIFVCLVLVLCLFTYSNLLHSVRAVKAGFHLPLPSLPSPFLAHSTRFVLGGGNNSSVSFVSCVEQINRFSLFLVSSDA